MPALLLLLIGLSTEAEAAGYHLLKLEGIYGTSEQDAVEAGFGAFVVSDQLGFWMTFGSPEAGGPGRDSSVKEWWLEGSWYGYQLGAPDLERLDLDPEDIVVPRVLFPYGWGRFGSDRTRNELLSVDLSQHLVFSIPGLWGQDARFLHVGPTAGAGLNTTWWDRWRRGDEVVNTGKLTAEAGLVAGANWRDAVYAQGRATAHVDVFGQHQANLNLAGVVGTFLGELGRPFGLELKGELDRGTDNFAAELGQAWSLQAVLYVKADVPDVPETERYEPPPVPVDAEEGDALAPRW